MVGMIMTGIFAADYGTGLAPESWGLAYGKFTTFSHHMIGLVGIAAFAFFGSYALYFITNKIEPMRVTAEEEELGLDITQHGESYQSLRIDL